MDKAFWFNCTIYSYIIIRYIHMIFKTVKGQDTIKCLKDFICKLTKKTRILITVNSTLSIILIIIATYFLLIEDCIHKYFITNQFLIANIAWLKYTLKS